MLLEYLAHPRSVPDPVLRQSEDAVESAAARALATWPTDEVLAVLLVRAALLPWPQAGDESPSSLRRRRSAAGLLAAGSDPVDWLALRPLLLEDDAGPVVSASRLAARTAPAHDRRLAASRLIELAGGAGSLASANIEECLVDLYPHAGDLVENEVARRSGALPASPQAPDSSLALLRRVVRRAAKS